MEIKIVFLGDNCAGKTSIIHRYNTKTFYDYQEPTIGAAFVSFTSYIEDKKMIFQIWDTAGQERYRSLTPMYYRNSRYAIIVFDMSDKYSFNSVKSWVQELTEKKPNCNKIIVGNKVDLEIKVNQKEIVKYINQNNLEYYEVSAKTGENITNLFDYIIQDSFINIDQLENNSKDNFSIHLDTLSTTKKNNNCC